MSRAARLGWSALGVPAFRVLFGTSLATSTAAFMLSAGISWSALVAAVSVLERSWASYRLRRWRHWNRLCSGWSRHHRPRRTHHCRRCLR